LILIQNALVLTPGFEAKPLDVLVDGGTIADIVPHGSVKGEGMERVDAAGKALMPGLVNGHSHAQTVLARGTFDRYNLETYLNAQPGASGKRTLEDKHLSALMGAAEMVSKGCTAAYDMFAEFRCPAPRAWRWWRARTRSRHARHDRADDGRQSFYEAIPAWPKRCPSRCAARRQSEVCALRNDCCVKK
jgi:cytosine/adenosine deaminase-related metal-dependent hydrolase